MSDDNETTLDIKPLKALIAALDDNKNVIRIGVLGDGSGRNAAIGASHEYGTSKIPQRSFLRVPLTEYLFKYLQKSDLTEEDSIKKIVKEKTMMSWFKKVALVAEKVVLDAFATGGFGKWKEHAPGYENKSGQILVDTQQLRNSIKADVV